MTPYFTVDTTIHWHGDSKSKECRGSRGQKFAVKAVIEVVWTQYRPNSWCKHANNSFLRFSLIFKTNCGGNNFNEFFVGLRLFWCVICLYSLIRSYLSTTNFYLVAVHSKAISASLLPALQIIHQALKWILCNMFPVWQK